MPWFQLMPAMCETQPFSVWPFSHRNCLKNVMFCLNYQQTVAKRSDTKRTPEWVTRTMKNLLVWRDPFSLGIAIHTEREKERKQDLYRQMTTYKKEKNHTDMRSPWFLSSQISTVSQKSAKCVWVWEEISPL